jgi:hypothetical protein
MRVVIFSCRTILLAMLASSLASSGLLMAQNAPIAIVPVEGVNLTGAINIADGKAMIGASGTVTAGEHPATITLPQRGNLRICATTKVGLTADSSVAGSATAGSSSASSAGLNPVGSPASAEAPGLMMALDRGAVEANFATGKNSDVILTPDFRIVISGPGMAHVQVRLGPKGDTCVDNHGADAPYVSVSSIFEGGVYRVQADQRVMFQHGSLREVVDREKEPCGCPLEQPASPKPNEFPLAQSEGLAPLPTPPPNAAPPGVVAGQVTAQLSYDGSRPGEAKARADVPAPTSPSPAPKPQALQTRPGFFGRIGHFFRKIFGG